MFSKRKDSAKDFFKEQQGSPANAITDCEPRDSVPHLSSAQ
jgi:hypothetical protein